MDKIGVSTVIEKIDYEGFPTWKLLLPPLAAIALAILILASSVVMTGAPVGMGVEFVGGAELRLDPGDVDGDPEEVIEAEFSAEPDSVQHVPADGTYIVTFKEADDDIGTLEEEAEAAGFGIESSSEITPTFGDNNQRLALMGLAFAFVGMSIMVFAAFRTVVPSACVVASAFSDLLVPLAMMSLVGIDLTLGTVAALLMMIGYSVDSDILLNDYVLRRSGGFYESVYDAMDTGLTMTLTSFLAMVVMAAASLVFGVPLLFEIGVVLAFGLAVDVMNTYMMNLAILRWYKFEGVRRL